MLEFPPLVLDLLLWLRVALIFLMKPYDATGRIRNARNDACLKVCSKNTLTFSEALHLNAFILVVMKSLSGKGKWNRGGPSKCVLGKCY